MKSRSLGYLAAALGIVLTAVGLWLAKTFPEAAGAMAALPYVLIGLGCGAFGHGVGGACQRRRLPQAPGHRARKGHRGKGRAQRGHP